MRLQLSSVVLALIPLTICGRSKAMSNTPNFDILDARAAEPTLVEFAPSEDQSYFIITNFDAFIPSPAYSTNFSRALFNIRLMHPNLTERWTTQCHIHTRSTLWGPDAWTNCTVVEGEENSSEVVSFALGENLSTLNIVRRWYYDGGWLSIMASEPGDWVRKASADDFDGNVTVSEMGYWYKRTEPWQFAWKQKAQ
ncbi:hypothetical protein OPT61_g908 [Boeremia exigua]|uniref:Uncharacterized protein n=1 Tax=Boeremia exigua TaxID=749465 RepID=A0ACC2IS39_9PLEO|nr:hypothetical protein OPT61_g908 [Boeremia exigua]